MTIQKVDEGEEADNKLKEKNNNMKLRYLSCRNCNYKILTDKIGLKCPTCAVTLITTVNSIIHEETL